ncbi:MAG: universal stress protein [Roseitalea sp.]|jgi:nucleotide-binding universal stress UspA family protein|nr:universal stress protein [Roseitalea sp.]MBO6722406.1 universal stress protein [Roseitalea sp.]MBO6741980.1 universal stress protein [Roseitalea sp.]
MTDRPAAPPFSNILAVCDIADPNADSLARAAALARENGARLTALAVGDDHADIHQLARFAGVDAADIQAGMMDALEAGLAERIAPFAGDLEIGIETRLGRPFREIIGDVIENGRDLVVKMAEPFDHKHRYLFTSTDQQLLRKCPCPVWLAMPGAAQPPKTILAAVDLDDENGPADEALNRIIIDTACRIAALNGATLHITHVWDAPAEDLVRRWTNDPDDVRRYLDATEDGRRKALDALARQAKADMTVDAMPAAIVPHLARGRPRDVIPAHVEAMGIDLLVIGTLVRTGIPGMIIGNTAEDVLNAIGCSVLTVKPPGYVSPLEHG